MRLVRAALPVLALAAAVDAQLARMRCPSAAVDAPDTDLVEFIVPFLSPLSALPASPSPSPPRPSSSSPAPTGSPRPLQPASAADWPAAFVPPRSCIAQSRLQFFYRAVPVVPSNTTPSLPSPLPPPPLPPPPTSNGEPNAQASDAADTSGSPSASSLNLPFMHRVVCGLGCPAPSAWSRDSLVAARCAPNITDSPALFACPIGLLLGIIPSEPTTPVLEPGTAAVIQSLHESCTSPKALAYSVRYIDPSACRQVSASGAGPTGAAAVWVRGATLYADEACTVVSAGPPPEMACNATTRIRTRWVFATSSDDTRGSQGGAGIQAALVYGIVLLCCMGGVLIAWQIWSLWVRVRRYAHRPGRPQQHRSDGEDDAKDAADVSDTTSVDSQSTVFDPSTLNSRRPPRGEDDSFIDDTPLASENGDVSPYDAPAGLPHLVAVPALGTVESRSGGPSVPVPAGFGTGTRTGTASNAASSAVDLRSDHISIHSLQ
ncbi:hypothetical protein BC831DRAFT_444173 [Entophlyctis helioformis]|nr:hypothetical protein BC831DRAFT_444173 [Entophlyctis helioformis]